MVWARWTGVLVMVVASVACDVTVEEGDLYEEVEEQSAVKEGDLCEKVEEQVRCPGGTRYCDHLSFEEEPVWGECVKNPECEPGETKPCPGTTGGVSHCILSEGVPIWDLETESSNCHTPLVLSFDSAPVRMEAAPAVAFDISDVGACVSTDWPTSVTPWLAIDLDRDGLVETGAELFGSGTRLPDGRRARDGFEALAALDSNGDGRISANDERFGDLVLWSDVDRDKRGTVAEFEALGARGILSIELDYRVDRRCDDRGNCEVERAGFRFIDAFGDVRGGEVIDVHLACR